MIMAKQYGISQIKEITNELDKHLENIRLKGYTIYKQVLSIEQCEKLNAIAEEIYQIQIKEFGNDNLKTIQEENVVRCPLYYDENFLSLITHPKILEILKLLFNNHFILHLQNIIINRPNQEHHQTSWHRDIPYQEYTTSQPISINVFYCTSPFNPKTGATKILPYSHLFANFPSINFAEENSVYIEADPGDVVIFNSWLFHRASSNLSNITRYGINHVFTLPIIKQQIDLPRFLNGKFSDKEELRTLLGYTFSTPTSVQEFRDFRLKKIKQ
jgi:ectoine hydroxylase-related dioxygenase (phytanoyl-CoA dioxygenase family)